MQQSPRAGTAPQHPRRTTFMRPHPRGLPTSSKRNRSMHGTRRSRSSPHTGAGATQLQPGRHSSSRRGALLGWSAQVCQPQSGLDVWQSHPRREHRIAIPNTPGAPDVRCKQDQTSGESCIGSHDSRVAIQHVWMQCMVCMPTCMRFMRSSCSSCCGQGWLEGCRVLWGALRSRRCAAAPAATAARGQAGAAGGT